MGFRFRKSIRLAKGVRINLSKSGASLSLGGKGATVNLSKRGTKTTIGIPGSGLSWSQTTKPTSAPKQRPELMQLSDRIDDQAGKVWKWMVFAVLGLIGMFAFTLAVSAVPGLIAKYTHARPPEVHGGRPGN